MLLFRFLTSLLVAWLLAGAGLAGGPVSGQASIAGPGLIEIEGQTVRLWGVLMPGRNTSEGAVAYDQFGRLIEGRALSCVPTDELDAPVSDAICRTQEGTDVAELLVREGWALDDGPRSRGHYLSEMEEAAARRRGVWGLTDGSDIGLLSEAERPETAVAGVPDDTAEEQVAVSAEPADGASSTPDNGLEAADVTAENASAAQPERAVQTAAVPAPNIDAPEARPSLGTVLQIASGDSVVQRAAELARMRASYPWLFENRSVRLIDPSMPGARYRAVIDVPDAQIWQTCARLRQVREACLLISRF